MNIFSFLKSILKDFKLPMEAPGIQDDREESPLPKVSAPPVETQDEIEPQDELRYTIDKDGWIHGPGVYRFPSVRTARLAGGKPIGIVWHWTGVVSNPEALVKRIQTYVRGKDRAASWHVLITRDGKMYQSVPCLEGSWHVGKRGKVGNRTVGVNQNTIGVELQGNGRLRRIENAWYAWPWKKRATHRVPDKETVRVQGNGVFHNYTQAQIDVARELTRALVQTYDIPRNAAAHGHIEYDPGRKEDPGPLWPPIMEKILDEIF